AGSPALPNLMGPTQRPTHSVPRPFLLVKIMGHKLPRGAARGGNQAGRCLMFLLTYALTWTADELGVAGGLLHYALANGTARTVGELAARTHLDGETVTSLLAVMEDVGLVEYEKGRWYANDGAGVLAYAADVLGVAGALEARRRRYAIESTVWEWWCAEQQVRRKSIVTHLVFRRYGRYPQVVSSLSWP